MKRLVPFIATALGFGIAALLSAGAASASPSSSSDAERCGKCGDHYCNPRCGENATSCPIDCGVST